MENPISPPLPDLLHLSTSTDEQPSIQSGTWLVTYEPVHSPFAYDGSLRIDNQANGRVASGDLYERQVDNRPSFATASTSPLLPSPDPAAGIPIQDRKRYSYYVSIVNIIDSLNAEDSIQLQFQLWRFHQPKQTWTVEGGSENVFNATMKWLAAPTGYPSSKDYLEGDVKTNVSEAIVGWLKMGWVSPFFRKVTVEIDTVPSSEVPLESDSGQNWATIFSALGWDATIVISDANVTTPSGESWSDAELHAAMLSWRDKSNLDTEWRYHILAVKRLDSTERGIMYDSGATDSDRIPREGVGIASHWMIPETGIPDWGRVKGQRFATAKGAYFRTAVHELGHAFGLLHNTIDLGFMNTSDAIAEAGQFPDNIKWGYADDDIKRLRHYPDVFVRPGGVPFGSAGHIIPAVTTFDHEIEVPELILEVTSLLTEVPLGAPVRVLITLTNRSEKPVRAPSDISLKYGFLRGEVRCESGTSRRFRPLVLCVDSCPMADLIKDETRAAWVTLLRGPDGALFPLSGIAEIVVQAYWGVGNGRIVVSGKTKVLITSPKTPEHAIAAKKVLDTPNTHLVLMTGGDHLEDGVTAIAEALAVDTLRPHFAAIEAKRLLRPFLQRDPDFERASDLLNTPNIAVTPAERSVVRMLSQENRERTFG